MDFSPRMLIVVAAIWPTVAVAQPPPTAAPRPLSMDEMVQQRSEKLEAFFRKLDTNGNGMIDAEEVSGGEKMLLERMVGPSGTVVKYPLAISQLHEAQMKIYRALAKGSGSGAADSPPPKTGPARVVPAGMDKSPPAAISPSGPNVETASAETASVPVARPTPTGARTSPAALHRSGRFLRPAERLPKGLPEWFAARDADADGQVSMAEYAAEWTPAKVAEFSRYDLNHDGIITPAECAKAAGPSPRR